MGDFEDKLNQLLSDSDAMAQVMQLAQSLSRGASSEPAPPSEPSQPARSTQPSPPPEGAGIGDLSAMLSQLTGGLDPQLLARLVPLVQQMNRPESSETAALLTALRPFLREKRRDKVARAAQLAKLIHLARVFLTTREE